MTAPMPLIIDTDPGVDDTFALILALLSPEVDVRAVTVTFGNVSREKTFANARRVLALAGRTDVPVAAGAVRPLVHAQGELAADWHGADGLGLRSAEFPEPGPADPRPAITLMADVLSASPEPVTIVSLGPMTNTALLLAGHPALIPRIARIVAMGGSLGTGNTRGAALRHAGRHRDALPGDVPRALRRRCGCTARHAGRARGHHTRHAAPETPSRSAWRAPSVRPAV